MGIRRRGLAIHIKLKCEKISEGKRKVREKMSRIKGCEKGECGIIKHTGRLNMFSEQAHCSSRTKV